MIRAYSEFYLNDAKKSLGAMFDYAVYDCESDIDAFAGLFVRSGCAKHFEKGNPAVISGLSGVELAQKVLEYGGMDKPFPEPSFSFEKTAEYWAGWALAEYQWHSGRRFSEIFRKVKASDIVKMYPCYHEMDISRFIEELERRLSDNDGTTRLKEIRESRGLSQSDLAKRAGVNLRSIQLYEQRVNDIDKAQGRTLYRLSHILGCEVEDLLESPLSES